MWGVSVDVGVVFVVLGGDQGRGLLAELAIAAEGAQVLVTELGRVSFDSRIAATILAFGAISLAKIREAQHTGDFTSHGTALDRLPRAIDGLPTALRGITDRWHSACASPDGEAAFEGRLTGSRK